MVASSIPRTISGAFFLCWAVTRAAFSYLQLSALAASLQHRLWWEQCAWRLHWSSTICLVGFNLVSQVCLLWQSLGSLAICALVFAVQMYGWVPDSLSEGVLWAQNVLFWVPTLRSANFCPNFPCQSWLHGF